jgi:hypothetical protein
MAQFVEPLSTTAGIRAREIEAAFCQDAAHDGLAHVHESHVIWRVRSG